MANETRIVSVLFVDLVASTALSVRLGDDETDRMRRRYFATLREAVSLHRGEEVSTAGDGMLAAFEGSAVDAVGCAVAIQRGIAGLNDRHPGLGLSVRVGVSVGEVAPQDGEWHGMPLVEGARLESAAQPDQILVSDLVRSLVGSRGGHRFKSVGALELKGLPDPLPVSEVEWVPTTAVPVVPVPAALDTADGPGLVGRNEELAALSSRWRSALDGATTGVAICGPSGSGKTRLAAAFAASLRAHDVIVLYGRCGTNAADRWEPLAQALRSYVAAARPEQVREAVGPYGSALSTVVPLLRRQLPELVDEAGRGDAEVPAAVSSFLEHVSATAPVLLVLDDLDDADEATRWLLDRLLSTPSRSRLSVLCLSREPLTFPNAALDLVELDGPTAVEPAASAAAPSAPSGEQGIIGRAEPRRRIEQCAAASARGRRSALFISGEAGIGKTTLIRAALESSATDAVIGWGTCWHGEGAPAFWAWTQALDDLARSVGADVAIDAAGADREALSVLIRDLGSASESHDDPERHRLLLLDATVRWLEALASDRHVVVVLDDLQWADPSTLDLLDHLIAAPVRARLFVVGSYRHDELVGDQRARLAGIVARTDHIHIEGLTLAEVEELIASISGAEAAAELAPELHRRTGGHPLFVSELARLPDVGSGGPLPTAVSEAVARRLRTLPDATRRLLDAGCVLGNRLLIDVLAAVTDQRPPDVMDGLEAAVDAGVVRAESAMELWFAHDLFRETLYSGLRAGERVALHGRVGTALEARDARGAAVAPGDVARHLTLAVGLGELEPAVRWARAAAALERRRAAFTEAAAHLRRVRMAIADAGWGLDAEELVSLLTEEADDMARSGGRDRALELLSQAASASTTPELRADVALAVQGLGAKFAARRDEIIAQLESALDGVAGADPIREARLTAALARELQHSVDEERARALPLSERALDLGRASGDDATLAACLLARHDTLWIPGTGAQRAALGHEIAEVAGRMGDIDRLAEGLVLEANGLLESGSPGFRPVLDRWFALMEERDEPHDRYMVMTRRAALALIEGRRKDAESLMEDAAIIGGKIHEPDTGNVLMSQRVALTQAIDDPDELRALAEDAVAWWRGAPVLAHSVAAGAYAAAGDLEEAAREVATVAESGGLESESSYVRSVVVGRLAEAATILGDEELCRELFDEIESLADSCGVNGAVVAFAGPFAHPAGILAAALGERDRAQDLLDQSIRIARRLGATAWIRRGEEALLVLGSDQAAPAPTVAAAERDVVRLERSGRIWTVTFAGETGSVNHVKGIGDIVELVRHPGTEIPALALAGGQVADTSREDVVDRQALDAYRQRLLDIEEELDEADLHGDAGRAERLTDEKERLLEELRQTTGLGGRIRPDAGAPAEKARKAVSARIRDAISRLEVVAPSLGSHLDRSIRTGMRCSYEPSPDDVAIRWQIED